MNDLNDRYIIEWVNMNHLKKTYREEFDNFSDADKRFNELYDGTFSMAIQATLFGVKKTFTKGLPK